MSDTPRCSPEVSMTGRMAWVIQELARLRGNGEQDAVRWVIDRWIDSEGRQYLMSYDIDLADFASSESDVLPIDKSNQKKGAG